MPALAQIPVVKTEVFEVPLDLLLDLIESRKLLINDISLATVTDEYIKRLGGMDELPIAEASEFVALAATLLLIKSRSLLPSLMLRRKRRMTSKNSNRLAMYQLIKEAGKNLSQGFRNAPLWEGYAPEPEPLFVPDKTATPTALHSAIKRLIEEFPSFTELPKVAVKKVVSLEEMIDRLAERVASAMRLSFKEFSGHGKSAVEKREVVVGFLALLELVKQGIIRATQSREFGDIVLEHDKISTPSY